LERVDLFLQESNAYLSELLGHQIFHEVQNSLKALIESLKFAEGAYQLPPVTQWTQKDLESWMKAGAKREQTMFWQMDEVLRDPNAKVVLLGHDFHLAKDSDFILVGEEGANRASAWTMLGTYLAKKYSGEVFSIWMLYDRGNRANGPECPAGECKIESLPGSINELMGQAFNTPYLLPLWPASGIPKPFVTPQKFLFNGRNVNRTSIVNQADLIFFVPEVSSF
jgi:erythromycin esterase-like protein